MRHCPQPIVAAIDGVCAGAGAMMALAPTCASARLRAQDRFPVRRVRPRRLRHGRLRAAASRHRPGTCRRTALHRPRDGGEEGQRWGFFNRWSSERLSRKRRRDGPGAGRRPDLRARHDQDHAAQEWSMTIDQAIEAEAQAQALCMRTGISSAPTKPSPRNRSPVRGELTCSSYAASPNRATPSRSPSCCVRSACRGRRWRCRSPSSPAARHAMRPGAKASTRWARCRCSKTSTAGRSRSRASS